MTMDPKRSKLGLTIDALVYLSVLLGAALLLQAFNQLPPSVAYAVLGGWLVYVVAAVLVLRKVRGAYPLVIGLAMLTLIVSLPQPEHYTLLNPGQILAGATFLLGSAVQVCLIILIPAYFLRSRKKA